MARLTGADAHRERILKVALVMLKKEGRDAVTTRSVAEAANVQPPVLYRIFGDKTGLLDAAASYGFEAYVAKKHRQGPQDDPMETLRTGWLTHVEFGLENPELYVLMFANPRRKAQSVAGRYSFGMLTSLMQGVAAAGRLRVSVERACALYSAAAIGIVMYLLALPPEQRDLSLSIAARDQALNNITTDIALFSNPKTAVTANQLRALLDQSNQEASVLTKNEQQLLSEWLLRLVDYGDRSS